MNIAPHHGSDPKAGLITHLPNQHVIRGFFYLWLTILTVVGLKPKSNRTFDQPWHRRTVWEGMRDSYLILTCVIFASCLSTKDLTTEQVVGKYQWHGIYGVAAVMDLKNDQTFEYNWQRGLLSGTTFGAWRIDGSKIVLNSELQEIEGERHDFDLVMKEEGVADSLSIRLIDCYNLGVPFATCVLKTDSIILRELTDIGGKVNLPRLDADSLIVSFVGYKTIRYGLDYSFGDYTFRMKEQQEDYEYFADVAWVYKKERLYDPFIKKGQFGGMKYYAKKE